MRFSKTDWIERGMEQLAEAGPAGLTIERLCAASGRTRGSFYHHFSDHDAFIRALMEHWKKRDTEDVIAAVETGASDGESDKAVELNALASALNHRLEGRIRQLAQRDETAAAILAGVDETRVEYLAALYRDGRGLERAQALTLAQLEYAACVGAQMLWPDAPPPALEALGAAFIKLARTERIAETLKP